MRKARIGHDIRKAVAQVFAFGMHLRLGDLWCKLIVRRPPNQLKLTAGFVVMKTLRAIPDGRIPNLCFWDFGSIGMHIK